MLCNYDVFNDAVNSLASNFRIISEWRIGKDVVGSGYDLI